MMTPDSSPSASDKSRVAICCATDDHYALYCGVTLASIINHASPEYSYDVTILESALHEKNKEKLLSLQASARAKGISLAIHFYNVAHLVEKREFHTCAHFTVETYYRLFIASIFPHHDKILYIDVDAIAQCDVAQLYATDIGDNWIGACLTPGIGNACITGREDETYYRELLGVSPYNEYFNAGILLLNLVEWRENKVEEKLLSACLEIPQPRLVDQCIMNKVCHGHVYYLDKSWNRPPTHYDVKLLFPTEHPERFEPNPKNPGIIHYYGRNKAWHAQNTGGRGDEWWAEAKTTPFFGEIIHFALCEMAKTELKKQDAQQTKKINELREALRQARIAHDAENKKQASEQAKTQAELNKAKAELAKLQKEQRAHREASAAMLREVALLPLTWLNLQRCRVAQHLTFGKAHERYKRKKKRLRERMDKMKKYLFSPPSC